jgi:hypothetical protein
MTLSAKKLRRIQDGRNHPAGTFHYFRALLSGCGAIDIQPDPKRNDFFELHRARQVFYFYLSPVSGDVLLLAVWKDKKAIELAEAPGNLAKTC